MHTDKWLDAQLQTARQLVQQGSQLLRQGNLQHASDALEQGCAVLDMMEQETEDVLTLRARALNEFGVVLQRQNKAERALTVHREAVKICEQFVSHGVEFRGNSAASYLNLSSILMLLGHEDEAMNAGQRAIELVEAAEDDEVNAIRGLAIGVYQNMAVIRARAKQFDVASEYMTRATALIDEMEAGAERSQLYVQAAQGCQQFSVTLFESQKFEEALHWGKFAEKYSESAYEQFGKQVLSIYIVSEVNLISYYEKLGRFAEGEDCLWKAIDVVGNEPQLLRRGQLFYENCRKQADSRLQAGNLPREEVEQGYGELQERIKAIGGLPPMKN